MTVTNHDVGYFGARVRNPLHGNAVVDYSTVPRKTIDDRFLSDLKLLCDRQLPKDPAANTAHKVWCAMRPLRRSGSCPELTFLSSREVDPTRRA
jgi:hypothetical protein